MSEAKDVKVRINTGDESAKPIHAITATTKDGRVLTLTEPDVLAPYRLVKIVGAEAAENRVYMSMVFPLLYLKTIDGDIVAQPGTTRELEALIQRLGHDGVRALRAGVEQHFGESSEDEEMAAVKK